jgi:hypothetical protein
MFDSLLGYMERLELQFFFSGFVTACAIIYLAGKEKLLKYFSLSYALVATLYLGWILKNLFPDYSIDHIVNSTQYPILKLFALSGMLFWIPVFRKTCLVIGHSIPFFLLVVYDFTRDIDHASNSLKIYLSSIALHLVAFLVVIIVRQALITLTARND